jgi:hypothetical protein
LKYFNIANRGKNSSFTYYIFCALSFSNNNKEEEEEEKEEKEKEEAAAVVAAAAAAAATTTKKTGRAIAEEVSSLPLTTDAYILS